MADDRPIRDCDDLDAHLTPFVDGEDAADTHRAVTAHLTACPPCRRHADDESAARQLVHEHRDELRVQAPSALRARCTRLQAPQSAPARSFAVRRWLPLSLAATLVLAVAGVFLFGLNNPVEALAASLALDHVKCFKVGDSASPADASAAERRWEHDEGWAIVVPKTTPSEQLTLVSVRHCVSTDGRTAHLMYRWRGAPLSLYVLPEDAGRTGVVTKMGQDAIIWSANRRTYAVVSAAPPQELSEIVDYMKANAR